MAKYQIVIGRAEPIDFRGMALAVPAKIDSGAYRSAIHATNIHVTKKGNQDILKFDLFGHKARPVSVPMETTDFTQVQVTNSFGHEETRYEIKLAIKLGNKVFNTSFTLADRSNNLFPVLVGRKCLKGRYLIDVNRTGIDRIKLKEQFGIVAPLDEEDLE